MMRKMMIGAAMAALVSCAGFAGDYPYSPAALTNVVVTGGFWLPRFETNRLVTVRADFKKCEETKRLANFGEVAKRGKFEGYPWNDSDVYKVIEGAAYTLATHPDAELEKFLDKLIADIAKAQEPDGYLYCARTLGFTFGKKNGKADYGMMGPTRWSNCQASHELYNVGHLYEAAVAYYQSTGKRTLLDVAIKNADLLVRTFGFGPTQLKLPPGHQEVEVGLCKLYRVTNNKAYLDLAKCFLDLRGRKDVRNCYTWGVGIQDHLPVLQQTEALGHAVRAGYMYMGMADVATLADDPSYMKAIGTLWENVVGKKLHLNGGIGARRHIKYAAPGLGTAGEAFGENYDLPNEDAYLETCAAIANALWNERLFLSTGDSKYIDVLERTIYNGFLSGISIGGDEFFYPNPLASKGKYQRSKWFGCSCCPVNVVRFIPQIAQFAYATRDDAAYVNLYLDSTAKLQLKSGAVKLEQKTNYPWDGNAKLVVAQVGGRDGARPSQNGNMNSALSTQHFTLNLRVPGWCVGKPVPSDLYTQVVLGSLADYTVKVNGKVVDFGRAGSTTPPSASAVGCRVSFDKGYCAITRDWKAGDVVEVAMNMPVRRIKANDAVVQDRGRLAVERGPLVYCAEGVDNGGEAFNAVLPAETTFTTKPITIATTPMTALVGSGLTLVPYFAWCHRGAGEMQTWFLANEKLRMENEKWKAANGKWSGVVNSNLKLEQDLGFEGEGILKVAKGATLDLNGHKLRVGGLKGEGTITDSSTGTCGELRIDVPKGKTAGNDGVAITGNLRVVKDGAGLYTPAKWDPSYRGGTEVAAGTLKCNCHAYTHKDGLLIRKGAAFDVALKNVDGGNGAGHGGYTLDGGALVNTSTEDLNDSWDSIHSIRLTADSSFSTASSFGLTGARFSPALLELGGHVFTVTVPAGKNFRLWNTDATGGTIKSEGDGELWLNKGALRANNATLDLGTGLRLDADGTVGNLTVRAKNGAKVFGGGQLNVRGVFKPVSGYLHNFCLLNGATLDLSDVRGVYAGYRRGKGLRFASGATVTVDIHGRAPAKGEQLISWKRKPVGVTFKWDAASAAKGIGAPVATRTGLYCGEDPNVKCKMENGELEEDAPARAWTKYEGNPVLGNSRLGTCFDINVITNGPAPFTMYFSWRPKGAIAFVRSNDGLHWTQEPEICLPPVPSRNWEGIVNRTTTVYKDGEYHMWYTGQNPKDKYRSSIGYAKSKDGVHFERVQTTPVMVAERDFEQPSVMCPCVKWDETRKVWRMWYSGGNTYEPDCNCYAESTDGIHWKKFAGNPILTKDHPETWDRDRVAGCEVHQLPDGRHVMFYIGYSDIHTARIGCAISKDGITGWKRIAQNPLVSPDLGSWDSCACYKPSVYRDVKNNRWLLWYNGRNGGAEYVGCVIHEGLDLEAPPAHLPDAKSLLGEYVQRFNDVDDECYQNAIPNDEAEEFLTKNVPYFACPDKDIEQIYYFRWWTFRKHIRKDLGCWTISEFLPNVPWAGAGNTIVCAAGHHMREGRWLRDPQYIVSDAKFWLTDPRSTHRWGYSSWLFTSACNIAEVHALDQLPGELLDSAVAYYRRWEQGFKRAGTIMGGDGKGGFLSVDGHEGTEMSLGGNGYKPLLASAMWSEATQIAKVAKSLGRNDLAAEFTAKAAVVAKSINANCWNPEVGFYTTATRDGKKGVVRELHGYAPWYFGVPTEGHAADWAQLKDPQGFAARYGITFPERRAKGFQLAYKGHECQWNGPSWPFSTTVALTAYMNDLHATKDAKVRAESNFPFLVWQYAAQHRRLAREKGHTMLPWIDENLNPDTCDWISRTVILQQKMKFARERGKDYNHSAFCDLVISGLVGFLPNGKQGFTVDPLCPATWDYFVLDNLRYRGHDVSIRWHRGHGGLVVKVDGKEVARRETLGKLDVRF